MGAGLELLLNSGASVLAGTITPLANAGVFYQAATGVFATVVRAFAGATAMVALYPIVICFVVKGFTGR